MSKEYIRENTWTAVSKNEPNEVRSVRKTKVRTFSCIDRNNWSISALLYTPIFEVVTA